MACLDVQCTMDGCEAYVRGHDIERAIDISDDGTEIPYGYIVYYRCDDEHVFAILVDQQGTPAVLLPDDEKEVA